MNKQSHSFLLWWSHAYRQYLHPSSGKAHSSRSLWPGSCGWEALCLPNFLSVNWLYTHLNNLSSSAWEWETDSCTGISLHQQWYCTVGACMCVLRGHSNLALFCRVLVGPVDSAGALITGSLCPPLPPKGNGLWAAIGFDVAQIHHTCGTWAHLTNADALQMNSRSVVLQFDIGIFSRW